MNRNKKTLDDKCSFLSQGENKVFVEIFARNDFLFIKKKTWKKKTRKLSKSELL
jgi:hypothetical protein